MSYGLHLRIDLGIVEHPKMLAVARENRWAWIEVLAYCRRNLTDGFIAEIVARRLGLTLEELMDLTYAGLLDQVPGGWQVHDWSDWNPTRQAIDDKREEISRKRSEAGRRGGQRSGESRRNRSNEANDEASASEAKRSNEAKRSPESESESETETTTKTLARRAVERASDFDTFWMLYPRKVGKRTAQAAYDRATKRATEADILAGLQRLIPAWTDPQFIPHPTTWLNRDGWEDQPSQQAAPASLLSLAEDARRLEEGRRFFA